MKGKEGRGLEKGNKNTNGQYFDLEQCIMFDTTSANGKVYLLQEYQL
jgi:hypothetical protein